MNVRLFAVFLAIAVPVFGRDTVADVIARAQAQLDASFADADEAIVAPVRALTPDTRSAPAVRLWTSTSKREIEAVGHDFRLVSRPETRLIEGADGRAIVPGLFCRCDGQLLLLLKKRGRVLRSIVIFHGTTVASDGLPSTGPMAVDVTVLAPFYRPLMKLEQDWVNQPRDPTAIRQQR